MTIAERIQNLVTRSNATTWEQTSEKYLFCDALLASADIWPTEARINQLERAFEVLLAYKVLA